MPIPMKERAPKRQSAKMRIYHTLCEWIMYGTLAPGERLNDQELCEYFEVSRTPIREALQMLEAQKLIVIFPNKATCVSEVDMSDLEKWYLPLAQLHGLAAQLACRKVEQKQVEELRSYDEQILHHVISGDVVGTLRKDLQLHNRLLEIAGNEFIQEFSNTLMIHIQRIEYIFLTTHGLSKDSFVSHRKLLDALEARDEKRSFDEMFDNWATILKQTTGKLQNNQ